MPVDSTKLQVQFAPRTEDLLASLLADLGQGSADPLVRECIVVQNRGMQRWLELQLSAGRGVWANPWFPFPQDFVRSLWRWVDPDRLGRGGDTEAPSDTEALVWAVAAVLPQLLDEEGFAPLRDWLWPDRDSGRLLGLARRVARVLDGYLLERPDLLRAWEAPAEGAPLPGDLADLGAEDAAWQAPLWRALLAEPRSRALIEAYPARLAERLIARLGALADNGYDVQPALERLGRRLPRVSVFGVSALSGVYVRILSALSRLVPVQVYTLSPSPADARAVRDLARRQSGVGWGPLGEQPPPAAEAVAVLDAVAAHPLVHGQATALRGFQMLVTLAGADVQIDEERDDRPVTPIGLLHRLQDDIVASRRPAADGGLGERQRSGADRSLGLHSCHGPLREAEVLRDQLLDAFDALPDLAPQDVVVMTPDLEAYAPYLQAVFGVASDASGGSQGIGIPFRLADRPVREGRGGIQAFLQAMHLLRGRMTAPEILDLLAMEPVRLARGVDEEGLDRLRGWVEEVGIRWGIDAEHRRQVDQPAFEQGTWRWGLSRMFLGWAAPGDGVERLTEGGLLPHAPAGAEPRLLGALADLVDLLDGQRGKLLAGPLPLEDWADRLGAFAGRLLQGGDAADQDERQAIERALGRLVERADRVGFSAPLGLDAVIGLLTDALEENPPSRGFLEGTVTVCALQPMRAIPFRVVALVGMNDGAFPRGDRPVGFDLAARRPRLGAVLSRDADRLLFLEALTCARERLIITWTGQDARGEAPAAPSVVVAELIDVLREMLPEQNGSGADGEDGWTAADAGPGDLLPQVHALHPYSPRYFASPPSPNWFSYAADFARAGVGEAELSPRPPLLTRPLKPRDIHENPQVLRLETLLRCWENPTRQFLHERLRIRLPERAGLLADRETLRLDPLQRWQAGESLVNAALRGTIGPEGVVAQAPGVLLDARGLLPLGTPGRLAIEDLLPTAEGIADLARPLCRGVARAVPVDLRLLGGRLRLAGSLDALYATGRVEAGYGRLDARRELRLWIKHLVLCCMVEEGALVDSAPRSWAVGRPEVRGKDKGGAQLLRLEAVPGARTCLETLVECCLANADAPLPFYPRAALAYAQALGAEALTRPAGPGETGGGGMVDDVSRAAALAAAARAFGADRGEEDGDSWRDTDIADPHLSLLLGDARPWNEDGEAADAPGLLHFQRLAALVYAPLLVAAGRVQGDEARAWVAEAQP